MKVALPGLQNHGVNRLIIVEMLEGFDEVAQLAVFFVTFIKFKEFLHHCTEAIHYKGSDGCAKEHEKCTDDSLRIRSGVVVAETYCR